jgi:hypothetical protein
MSRKKVVKDPPVLLAKDSNTVGFFSADPVVLGAREDVKVEVVESGGNGFSDYRTYEFPEGLVVRPGERLTFEKLYGNHPVIVSVERRIDDHDD